MRRSNLRALFSQRISPISRQTGRLIALAGVSLALVACGGESSGGGDQTPVISGIVAKGPIQGSTVFAFQGASSEPVGPQATTDAAGRFSIRNVTNYSGPVRIRVDGGAFINEADNQNMTLDVSLEAYSVIESISGTTTVNVTPLTTLAVEKLRRLGNQAAGQITSQTVVQTNSQVAANFGLSDMIRVTPTNLLTESVAAGELSQADRYGILLAGISQLVAEGDFGQSLTDVLNAFSDDLADGDLSTTDGALDAAIGQLGSGNPALLSNIPVQALVSVASSTGAGQAALEIGNIALSVDPTPLSVGETRMLNAVSFPRTSANSQLTYSSSAPQIVQVEPQSGLMTGVSPGTAVLTASSTGELSINDSATVTVRNNDGQVPPPLEGLTVNAPGQLVRGNTARASAIPVPETAILRAVQWASSAPNIVNIQLDGTITATNVGVATITATSGDKSGTAQVQVVLPELQGIAITGSSDTLNIVRGSTPTISVVAIPNNANFGTSVTWTSSNPSVVSVPASGAAIQITAVAVGEADVTATVGGFTATKRVVVGAPAVSGLVIQGSSTVEFNGSKVFTAIAQPANANLGTLTWASSNPQFVGLSQQNGDSILVSGLAAGVSTITVRSSTNPSVVTPFTVTVPAPPAPPAPPEPEPEPVPAPAPAPVPVPEPPISTPDPAPAPVQNPDISSPDVPDLALDVDPETPAAPDEDSDPISDESDKGKGKEKDKDKDDD